MLSGTLKHWRASFGIFSSKELLVLVFAAVKTYQRALSFLFKYFWWLLGLDIALHLVWAPYLLYGAITFLGFAAPIEPGTLSSLSLVILYFVTKLSLSFIAMLGIRASVEPKNYAYCKMYSYKLGGYFLLFSLLVGGIYLFPIAWLVLFFYLDAKGGVREAWPSFARGLKLTWYFLPIIFIFSVLEALLDAFMAWVIRLLLNIEASWYIIGSIRCLGNFFLWLLLMSLLINWYIKVKHSNYELFSQAPNRNA